jgi:hypothetical protein
LHCILSYCVSFTIHYILPASDTQSGVYPVCIPAYILSMSCLYPVYVRHSSGVHPTCSPFYHLRSYFTFGHILPRILEQVLCPRYSTFLSIFISFIIDVREIYKLHCILSYGVSFTIHYIRRASRRASGVHPTFIRRAPDVQSFLHLRSNLTFGTILPRILEQVLCPRYSTFLSFFITFIYRCSRDL